MENNPSKKSHRWTMDQALLSHIPPGWATATFSPWDQSSPFPFLRHLAKWAVPHRAAVPLRH